ncbi:opioid-binding protein/cell adhesion molecule-like [Brachionichthys hirsutus]|uniref:opioid-binding protein/cell adhesion molecule-like n=1 Tax=Brachionichthys hirsutus TaxID=412623 RepID=UPI0036053858
MNVILSLVLAAFPAAADVFLASPGRSATIECGGDTSYSNLAWFHKNELILKVRRNGVPSKGKALIVRRTSLQNTKLVIMKVTESDAGMFTCEVDGKSHQHALLVATVSTSPPGELRLGSKATLRCEVKGLMEGSTVQWKNPFGSPHTGAELNPVTRSHHGSWNCTFSHNGVTYNERLVVKVTGPAPKTPSPNLSESSDDTPNAPPTTGVANAPPNAGLLLGLSWWMWVVILVGGGVVLLLLLVAVICLYKRIKRKKRKLLKMRNGHQPLTPRQYCQCNRRPTAAAKLEQRHRRKRQSVPPPSLQLLLAE